MKFYFHLEQEVFVLFYKIEDEITNKHSFSTRLEEYGEKDYA